MKTCNFSRYSRTNRLTLHTPSNVCHIYIFNTLKDLGNGRTRKVTILFPCMEMFVWISFVPRPLIKKIQMYPTSPQRIKCKSSCTGCVSLLVSQLVFSRYLLTDKYLASLLFVCFLSYVKLPAHLFVLGGTSQMQEKLHSGAVTSHWKFNILTSPVSKIPLLASSVIVSKHRCHLFTG